MSRLQRGRLLASLALVCALLGCAPEPGANVLLIVIDTLRADRLSSYGYSQRTTPGLDALAARGVRFANARSTSSWTLPAHASMFTGAFPIEHGATQEYTQLDDRLDTLAEILASHGYATFGASGNGVLNENSGLERGFAAFDENWRLDTDGARYTPEDHPNLLSVRRFLSGLDASERFFVFVNYIEVHGPYRPPEPYRSRFLPDGPVRSLLRSARRQSVQEYYLDKRSIAEPEFRVLNALYDGEVAYVDSLVAALVKEVQASGHVDDTLVIVTSDHGENIGDHEHYRHVFSLYNTTVRVPLIVLLPGLARSGEVRAEPVSLVDLFPTILAAAGLDPAAYPSHGRDILADPGGADRPIFAEYYYPLQALQLFGGTTPERYHAFVAPLMRRLRSVERSGKRYLWSSDGTEELYDLESDPDERVNLARSPNQAALLDELRAELADYVERGGGDKPLPADSVGLAPVGAFEDLDDETARQLRELGYVHE